MITREKTRPVQVGGLTIGGGAPVVIQSMTNTKTSDVSSTLKQIRELKEAGCELVRVAVRDEEAVAALSAICRESPLPVIADIHFNYRLALAAMDAGAAKIRINPGNIGGKDRLAQIFERAGEKNIPLRIGVNAGSLEKNSARNMAVSRRRHWWNRLSNIFAWPRTALFERLLFR